LYLTLFSNANTFQTGLPRLRNKTSPLANHKKAQNSKYAIPIPKEHIFQSLLCKLKTTISLDSLPVAHFNI